MKKDGIKLKVIIMAYKPWEVQENLWKEKCKWGNRQNKEFLVRNMAQRTGKSVFETLRDIKFAEQSGMLHTNTDSSVEIKVNSKRKP